MISEYDLQHSIASVGIVWSFGYYDQNRHEDGSLKAEFISKQY